MTAAGTPLADPIQLTRLQTHCQRSVFHKVLPVLNWYLQWCSRWEELWKEGLMRTRQTGISKSSYSSCWILLHCGNALLSVRYTAWESVECLAGRCPETDLHNLISIFDLWSLISPTWSWFKNTCWEVQRRSRTTKHAAGILQLRFLILKYFCNQQHHFFINDEYMVYHAW